MTEVRVLIENYWINKVTNKELYFKIKKALPKFRKFFTEQLGWRVIVNERIIKLEKMPAYAESFMGINTFKDVRDYCILCALLTFLEDKEDNEQFLLSELVDMIEIQLKEFIDVDWTKFVQRKSLIRAMQYAEHKGMLIVYEGSSDNLSSSMDTEILYENTGLSRYFATSFSRDISEYTSYRDFETEQIQDVDSDRGYYRINRVYRQLVSSPVMYWEEPDDQDYLYVKNQRQWVQKYLDGNLGGELHIHKNGAFFVMDENDCFGSKHPRDAMISELVLIICAEIRNEVADGSLKRGIDDSINIKKSRFSNIIAHSKEKYDSAWSKEYREMELDKLIAEVVDYMEQWMMLKIDNNEFMLYPAIGKFVGKYPKDFKVKGVDENE
jgi:uncharacterized protein (TIGR02678 family)